MIVKEIIILFAYLDFYKREKRFSKFNDKFIINVVVSNNN